ncbi:MAG: hypothetical protein IAE88_18395 [Rhodobacteraceae bacterium]|nr:hypothetical protein [Paracoccaceae bacterium]
MPTLIQSDQPHALSGGHIPTSCVQPAASSLEQSVNNVGVGWLAASPSRYQSAPSFYTYHTQHLLYAMTPLKQYSDLLNSGRVLEAEKYLLANLREVGYGPAINHLWRFQNHAAFDDVRAQLANDAIKIRTIPWQALELLYYLQEKRISGDANIDNALALEPIFHALCSRLGGTSTARNTLIQFGLLWHGIFETSNDSDIPLFHDKDVKPLYGALDDVGRRLMESARVNRYREAKVVVEGRCLRDGIWGNNLDASRCAEIYIGPYFFRDLSSTQRSGAKLPESFASPFQTGLRLLMDFLLDRGWQIMPMLCWRGALAPSARRIGRLSFSYHTHGAVEGRYHYKFGHFSDLMTIDPDGYAGFSKFANNAQFDVTALTQDVSLEVIHRTVERYKSRYIDNKITWRVQPPSLGAPLEKGERTIFIPLQDPFDEVAQLRYLETSAILRTVANTLGNEDVIYVKRHPVDRTTLTDRLFESFAPDKRIRFVDRSIHEILAVSDTVVTVNSGVGFEALLAGLPVIIAGKSDYNLVATTVKTVDELSDALKHPSNIDHDDRLRFLYTYFEHHALDPKRPQHFLLSLIHI